MILNVYFTFLCSPNMSYYLLWGRALTRSQKHKIYCIEVFIWYFRWFLFSHISKFVACDIACLIRLWYISNTSIKIFLLIFIAFSFLLNDPQQILCHHTVDNRRGKITNWGTIQWLSPSQIFLFLLNDPQQILFHHKVDSRSGKITNWGTIQWKWWNWQHLRALPPLHDELIWAPH